jgi:hypothetical protein
MLNSQLNSEKLKRWLLLGLRYGGALVIGLVTSSLATWVFDNPSRVVGFLSSFLNQFWINLVGVILVGLVGAGLYYVRQRWRILYGLIEIGFALAYGWYAVNKVQHVGYIEMLSIIAAVYLVVRGFDNVMIGRAEKRTATNERGVLKYRLKVSASERPLSP